MSACDQEATLLLDCVSEEILLASDWFLILTLKKLSVLEKEIKV